MKQLEGDQLSLIAEEEFDDLPRHWDDPCPPLRERSLDEIRQHFIDLANGVPPKKPPSDDPDLLINKPPEFWDEVPDLPISKSLLDFGGQNKNSPPEDFGGHPQTSINTVGGNGRQNKNPPPNPPCPPKTGIFDKQPGDDGTWIEIEHRKSGSYKFLRWREYPSRKKKSKYMGVVK